VVVRTSSAPSAPARKKPKTQHESSLTSSLFPPPPASSLKAKLFLVSSPSSPLQVVATSSASNVGAKGKKVVLKIAWEGVDVKEGGEIKIEKEQEEVKCESVLTDQGRRRRIFSFYQSLMKKTKLVLDTDTDLPGLILGMLTEGEKKSVEKEEIRWVTHRM